MAGRSLHTSEQGIARAKRALLWKNLTQKAIANELGIASWSTVSKFFNGKPVDRLLFMEICHVLELDWSEVAAAPEVEEDGGVGKDREDGRDKEDGRDRAEGLTVSEGADELRRAVREQAAIAVTGHLIFLAFFYPLLHPLIQE